MTHLVKKSGPKQNYGLSRNTASLGKFFGLEIWLLFCLHIYCPRRDFDRSQNPEEASF